MMASFPKSFSICLIVSRKAEGTAPPFEEDDEVDELSSATTFAADVCGDLCQFQGPSRQERRVFVHDAALTLFGLL